MSTKAPVSLKRGSQKGKRKPPDVLNSEMISPPLGDFRHTIHIGSRGADDVFGDLSFLEGKLHLLPGRLGQISPRGLSSKTASFREGGQPQSLSPLLKNAISLPAIGGPRAPPKPPRLHLDSKEGESRDRGSSPDPSPADGPSGENFSTKKVPGRTETLLPHAVSLLSLQLDLGPSILDDILEVMDQKQDLPPGVSPLVCPDPGARSSPRSRGPLGSGWGGAEQKETWPQPNDPQP
ncbi:cdc42 effector protein 2-like [Pristis pectinata]|uniref:cdc42 effector protein 2-like n=1 Tax=Pristis pectinata TaxID=685728 RepID=UPI00223CBB93|nr:cdc42 effector protein 2-like [Pristis pectinata]XP_051901124.1 cdc42 effector protein 2-like [Pristis pectinata]XP_051901126.1 cdc42 effector protein 2-like [Pristis pectinata]XP_051901127.1 cdc42 effector protein 2-like [Pristis pectinata]XP_051901128.1 cdc42 effector protein 2-like [Pristis pectinata]XP_051901129.1 cdc42 effector protein 2-like [Pristis pectinata]XP_051901130.1 cdc42 effector protein 2-like [Pristis pectinata]XP_051901131.1 cdc42 effector protein 2-like [Pristis pectin